MFLRTVCRRLAMLCCACLLSAPAFAEKILWGPNDMNWESISGYFCLKVTQISRNEVASFTKLIEENSPYPFDDHFQKAACWPDQYGSDVKAPMLHLFVDKPVTRAGFTEVIYKYYAIRRKDESLWLKAVNAKNTLGEAYLDYIETRMRSGYYSNSEVLEAVLSTKAFICAHGAVYARYTHLHCP